MPKHTQKYFKAVQRTRPKVDFAAL